MKDVKREMKTKKINRVFILCPLSNFNQLLLSSSAKRHVKSFSALFAFSFLITDSLLICFFYVFVF